MHVSSGKIGRHCTDENFFYYKDSLVQTQSKNQSAQKLKTNISNINI